MSKQTTELIKLAAKFRDPHDFFVQDTGSIRACARRGSVFDNYNWYLYLTFREDGKLSTAHFGLLTIDHVEAACERYNIPLTGWDVRHTETLSWFS